MGGGWPTRFSSKNRIRSAATVCRDGGALRGGTPDTILCIIRTITDRENLGKWKRNRRKAKLGRRT